MRVVPDLDDFCREVLRQPADNNRTPLQRLSLISLGSILLSLQFCLRDDKVFEFEGVEVIFTGSSLLTCDTKDYWFEWAPKAATCGARQARVGTRLP